MKLAVPATAEVPATQTHEFLVTAATLGSMSRRSSRRARLRSAEPIEVTGEVEAILRVFAPAWRHVATPIPGGGSGSGELVCLEQHGVQIAERGPSGDDGGAYLYLLANGTVAELRQWPARLSGSEGWTGLLAPISLRRALGRYPELRPATLAKGLTDTLHRWLKSNASLESRQHKRVARSSGRRAHHGAQIRVPASRVTS
jgi:hypothetical protein